jgi:hypothetical protein
MVAYLVKIKETGAKGVLLLFDAPANRGLFLDESKGQVSLAFEGKTATGHYGAN